MSEHSQTLPPHDPELARAQAARLAETWKTPTGWDSRGWWSR